MSGIAGVWNIDGRPLDMVGLALQRDSIAHRGSDGFCDRASDTFGLVHLHRWVTAEEVGERQPLVEPDGVVLALDGRLDNRVELIERLRLSPRSTDAACVLAAYRAWGDECAARLAGDFAIAIFDKTRPHLLLARDPIGIRPLYYFHSRDLIVFGSEIKAVIADPRVPKEPDDEGLADFLLISSRPVDGAERTCFRGIHALLPSCLALITPKRLTIRRYWDFDPARQIRFPSTDQYVEAFRERFAEAVRRRLRSAYPVAVAVSGGLDSSSIFCQAQRLLAADVNRPPPLVGISFVGAPGGPGDERRYLNEIAREYHARLESFDAEPLAGILRGATEQMRLTEAPLFDYLWGITSELDRRAAAAGARVLLGGHWGDQVLFSSAYLVDLFNRGAWHRIRSHLREFARWSGAMEARALTRRFYVDLARHHLPRAVLPVLKRVRRRLMGIERPKEWFASAFLEHALVHADQPATLGNGFHSAQARAIYFEARSKYHVHCLEWHNKIDAWHGLDAALPMMDRDLLAFLMAIPGEVQNANGVPRAILRSAMRGILPETIRCRASKGDFSYLVNDGVAGDAARLARVLSPESLGVEMGYFNPVRLRPAVDRLAERSRASAECIDSWDLADMFGLEMWLQVFFPRSPKTPDALGRSEETLHDEAESHGSSPQKATLSNTAVAHLR